MNKLFCILFLHLLYGLSYACLIAGILFPSHGLQKQDVCSKFNKLDDDDDSDGIQLYCFCPNISFFALMNLFLSQYILLCPNASFLF